MTEHRELTMTLEKGVVADVLTVAKLGLRHVPGSRRRDIQDSIDAVLDEAQSAEQGYVRSRRTEVPLD